MVLSRSSGIGVSRRLAIGVMVALAFCLSLPAQDAAPGQTEVPPSSGRSRASQAEGTQLWMDVRSRMRRALERLDAFTCIQTIGRYAGTTDREPVLRDTVRLQVTASRGKEYFSFPGSPSSVDNPVELVRSGLSGTGLFHGYVHSLFLKRAAGRVEFAGEETASARRLLHFRFQLDSLQGGLDVTVSGETARVSAKGEFWVDAEDLLLRRFVVESGEAAPEINVSAVRYLLDWAPVKIGGERMMIPESAEVVMRKYTGEVLRNQVTLSQCREFRAESSIRFDGGGDAEARSAVDGSAPAPGTSAAGYLPAGLTVPLSLFALIDSRTAAVGDPFEAVVARDVLREGNVVLRKGATAEGRIRRLDHYSEPSPHLLLWLEIALLRDGGREFVFLGELTKKGAAARLVDRLQHFTPGRRQTLPTFGMYTLDERETLYYPSVPGVGSFLFRGDSGTLPAGFSMEWKTLDAGSQR